MTAFKFEDGPTRAAFSIGEVVVVREAEGSPLSIVLWDTADNTFYAGLPRWSIRLRFQHASEDNIVRSVACLRAIPRDEAAWFPVTILPEGYHPIPGYLRHQMFVRASDAHRRCLNCRCALMAHTDEGRCIYDVTHLQMPGGGYMYYDLKQLYYRTMVTG